MQRKGRGAHCIWLQDRARRGRQGCVPSSKLALGQGAGLLHTPLYVALQPIPTHQPPSRFCTQQTRQLTLRRILAFCCTSAL